MSQYPDAGRQPQERVVTTGEWVRLLLVSLFGIIPVIGWIVMLIIYIVKATDTRLPQSYRNLIKAGFIWAAVWVALGILVVVCLLAYGISVFDFSVYQDAIEKMKPI